MENQNKKIGILGYGEVGKAIASFYTDPFIEDIEKGNLPEDLDVLHVCIPFTDETTFIPAVMGCIKTHCKPEVLVIIHSTVPVGTTQNISIWHKNTVHSPVRGVHPNLAQGIKTFVKFIGSEYMEPAIDAMNHLHSIGINSTYTMPAATTELLKLLDTTYYGLAIAFHGYAEKLCERNHLDFNLVMTMANQSYNEGYQKLGKSNVVRPVLSAPGEKIGGHCVIPNAEILLEQFGSDPILQAILKYK